MVPARDLVRLHAPGERPQRAIACGCVGPLILWLCKRPRTRRLGRKLVQARLFDDGTPLGSLENGECRIDSIAQSWSAISGAADPARAAQAMAAADDQLVRRDSGLALLFTPPFDRTPLDPGYIKGYPPGIRENGGQYTHAAAWLVIAHAMLGNGDKAAELFSLLNPINHASTRTGVHRYKVEPYVIAADLYSESPHIGRGGWTWYTGSAGWMYRAGIEAILGLRRKGQFLVFDPCIPRLWPGFKLTKTTKKQKQQNKNKKKQTNKNKPKTKTKQTKNKNQKKKQKKKQTTQQTTNHKTKKNKKKNKHQKKKKHKTTKHQNNKKQQKQHKKNKSHHNTKQQTHTKTQNTKTTQKQTTKTNNKTKPTQKTKNQNKKKKNHKNTKNTKKQKTYRHGATAVRRQRSRTRALCRI
jgi:hypothetical protein